MINENEENVYFGFNKVKKETKKILVKDLFNDVADKYDLMNDLMSFFLHRAWKKDIINYLENKENSTYLDLAGGTGDIACNIIKKDPTSKIYICDISFNMMSKGRSKIWNKGIYQNINWIAGDCTNIPIKNSSVDNITISFGLRNVSDIDQTIKECNRVLKPGGKFLCLEFSPDITDVLKPVYSKYSFKIIPLLGKLIAKNEGAYQYLIESIRNFPMPAELTNKINKNGFGKTKVKRYLGGIACLHYSTKI